MNPNQKTIEEVEIAAKQLRYEGKATKEEFDWFSKEYLKHQQEQGNKRRHREQESPVLDIR